MDLIENFDELTLQEKKLYFLRNYASYVREGEWSGLRDDAPEDVKVAFEAFLEEYRRSITH